MANLNFKIDPGFEALLPQVDPEYDDALRISLQTDGLICPLVVLVVDGERLLGDGHRRFKLCQELHIPIHTKEIKIPSRELAIEWMIVHQLSRRNLTDQQRSYYRGKEYLHLKKGVGRPKLCNDCTISGESTEGVTAEKVAARNNVSVRTVLSDAEFAEVLDRMTEQQRRRILQEKSSETKKAVIEKKLWCKRCLRIGVQTANCKGCRAVRENADVDRKGRRKSKGKRGRRPKRRTPADLKDAFGCLIPDRCRDMWADPTLENMVEEIESVEVMLDATAWVEKLGKLLGHYPFLLVEKAQAHLLEALSRLQLGLEAVKAGIPYAICPRCHGEATEKPCRACRGSGLVPEHRYREESDAGTA